MTLEKEKLTVKDFVWIIGGIVTVLSLGITIGIFSNRLNSVEASVSNLETKVTQIDQINQRLATIDANLSFLKYKLTGVSVINEEK